MRISISNALDELATVMESLEAFCHKYDIDMRAAQAAELALDELLSNCIFYGFPDGGNHTIIVEIDIVDRSLRIVVTDDGVAFNPLEQSAPDLGDSIDDRELGGVGIHLVRQIMDSCEYTREGDQNVMELTKRLPAA